MFYRTSRPNLYDYIKIMAIALMIVDHVGYFLFPELYRLRAVGRFAMPIFLFLVGLNGFYKRSWGLAWGAVAAQIARMFYHIAVGSSEVWVMSILVVIVLARILLYVIDSIYRRSSRTVWVLTVVGVALVLFSLHGALSSILDYGSYALLWALWGHVCYRLTHTKWTLVGFLALSVPFLVYQYGVFGVYFGTGWREWIRSGSLISSLVLWRVVTHNDSFSIGGVNEKIVYLSTQALRIYVYHVVVLAIVGALLYLVG